MPALRDALFLVVRSGFLRLHFSCLITKLVEALDDGLRVGLVGIVSDGYALPFNVALNLFDTLLETKVARNLLLTVVAVHLRLSGDNNGLNVLGHTNHCG